MNITKISQQGGWHFNINSNKYINNKWVDGIWVNIPKMAERIEEQGKKKDQIHKIEYNKNIMQMFFLRRQILESSLKFTHNMLHWFNKSNCKIIN